MDMKKLNYLLHKIYIQEYDDFNDFYNDYSLGIKKIAKDNYSVVRDKTLYSELDLIQEIWITIFEDLLNNEQRFSDEKDFNMYITEMFERTLAKINN